MCSVISTLSANLENKPFSKIWFSNQVTTSSSVLKSLLVAAVLCAVTESVLAVPATPLPPVVSPIPADTSDSVGTTQGSFQVSPTGSATYSIPILTAQGSGGVSPKVSLNYNQRGSNGIAGIGWSIGGLSSITRCRQTNEQDGQSAGITLTAGDRFCLNGQRLMVVSGTYGANGAEYRKERDDYSRITSLGSIGTGPDHFVVEKKDGTIAYYGNTANSRLMSNGANSSNEVVTWGLNRVEDRSVDGNPLDYSYVNTTADGVLLIDNISWVGAENHIDFVYEARPDSRVAYHSDSQYKTEKRLAQITSTAADSNGIAEELRQYTLSYQNSVYHGKSELIQIQECHGSVCYNPTIFDWEAPTAAGGYESTSSNVSLSATIGAEEYGYDSHFDIKTGDVNGDGRQDLIWIEYDSLNQKYWVKISLSMGDYLLPQKNGFHTRLFSIASNFTGQWEMLDFDNDGDDDFVFQQASTMLMRESINGMINYTSNPRTLRNGMGAGGSWLDFNGDGRVDYLEGNTVRLTYLDVWGNWQMGYPITLALPFADNGDPLTYEFAGDFNADGDADLIVKVSPSGADPIWHLLTADIENSQLLLYKTIEPGPVTGILPADFNKDGYTDYLVRTGASYTCHLNLGRPGEFSNQCGSFSMYLNAPVMFTDYDHDGDVDVIFSKHPTTTMKAYEWDYDTNQFNTTTEIETGLFSVPTYYLFSDWTRFFADINGDGKQDYIAHYKKSLGYTNKHQVYFAEDRFESHEVINKITNGLGAEINIEYHATTDPAYPNLYVKDTDAASLSWGNGSEVFDIKSALNVVETVSQSSPIAGDINAKRSTSYSYAGAKYQAGGRGFLGFREVTVKDNEKAITSTTTYRQDHPFTGMAENVQIKQPNGNLISEITNTLVEIFDSQLLCGYSSASQLVSEINISQREVTTYDLTNYYLKTETSTNTQGQCGNTLTSTLTQTNGYDSKTHTVTRTYSDDTSLWLIGKLASKTESVVRNGVAGNTRVWSYSHDATTGFLTQNIREPGNADDKLILTSDITYDSHGNQTSVMQTPGNVAYAAREEQFVYDLQGQHVDVKKDYLGNALETVVSRNAYGLPENIRDVNDNDLYVAYGDLGRKYYEHDLAGAFTQSTTKACGGCVGAPTGTVFMIETTGAGVPTQRSYFDLLGREIRQSREGFGGVFVYVDTEYDTAGRVSRKSEPYNDGSVSYWTSYTYDLLDRPLTINDPAGFNTLLGYSGFTIAKYDSLMNTLREYRNVLGELIKARDHLGNLILYTYHPDGTLHTTTSPGGSVTTINYDLLGRKTSMDDPDKGLWTYTYTAFGELESQTDAESKTTSMFYDQYGRMVERTDKDALGTTVGESSWLYDFMGWQGRLYQESISTFGSGTEDIVRTYSYDGFTRPSAVQTDITGEGSYTNSTTYDEYGRVFQQFDAAGSGAGIQYGYSQYGYNHQMVESRNSATETILYSEVLSIDARGNVSQDNIGGFTTNRSYDAATGRIDFIQTGILVDIQDLSYSFDRIGNLISRTSGTESETFTYDQLYRMTSSSATNYSLSMTYDGAGNITSKSNMPGTYVYGAGTVGPHAVTSIGATSYSYDANGNMISGDGRTITYDASEKPVLITKGSAQTALSYGPNRSRYKRVDTDTNGTTKTLYLGGVEIITRPDGDVETKRYINGKLIITTSVNNPSEVVQALFTDYQGSTDAIVNLSTGVIDQGMSFDAFGLRRDNIDWSSLTVTELVTFYSGNTTKGYTGHEQMDAVGLIHMNGRVYDPLIGRFISADPFVQAPTNTQSYNRYSYVVNNPLRYIDPSGYDYMNIDVGLALDLFFRINISHTLGNARSFCRVGCVGSILGQVLSDFYAGKEIKTEDFLPAEVLEKIAEVQKQGVAVVGGSAGGETTPGANVGGDDAVTNLNQDVADDLITDDLGPGDKVWDDAQKNLDEAANVLLTDLEAGELNSELPGLLDDFNQSLPSSVIKIELVKKLEGDAHAKLVFDRGGENGGYTSVLIQIPVNSAILLGDAIEVLGHEFRHLTNHNQRLPSEPLEGAKYDPQELDALKGGRRIRKKYGY